MIHSTEGSGVDAALEKFDSSDPSRHETSSLSLFLGPF